MNEDIEIKLLRQKVSTLQTHLTAREQEVERLTESRDGWKANWSSSEDRIIELRAEVERLQSELTSTQADARTLREESHRRLQVVGDLYADVARLRALLKYHHNTRPDGENDPYKGSSLWKDTEAALGEKHD
jgi:chromosome segregation ATPase